MMPALLLSEANVELQVEPHGKAGWECQGRKRMRRDKRRKVRRWPQVRQSLDVELN